MYVVHSRSKSHLMDSSPCVIMFFLILVHKSSKVFVDLSYFLLVIYIMFWWALFQSLQMSEICSKQKKLTGGFLFLNLYENMQNFQPFTVALILHNHDLRPISCNIWIRMCFCSDSGLVFYCFVQENSRLSSEMDSIHPWEVCCFLKLSWISTDNEAFHFTFNLVSNTQNYQTSLSLSLSLLPVVFKDNVSSLRLRSSLFSLLQYLA